MTNGSLTPREKNTPSNSQILSMTKPLKHIKSIKRLLLTREPKLAFSKNIAFSHGYKTRPSRA
jgi:hypothetical protein